MAGTTPLYGEREGTCALLMETAMHTANKDSVRLLLISMSWFLNITETHDKAGDWLLRG
jgi:hypothetical protein